MDFLFERTRSLNLSLSVHPDDDDILLLSQNLWSLLVGNEVDRVAISVSRLSDSPKPTPPSLTCWCTRDLHGTVAGMSIPHRWLEDHHDVFSEDDIAEATSGATHTVAIVRPVFLTEVVINALSVQAYEAATSNVSVFQDWISSKSIIRSRFIYTVDSGDPMFTHINSNFITENPLQYQVALTEPVRQGIVQRDVTRIYLAADGHDEGRTAHAMLTPLSPSSLPQQDDDDVEIDESFLAGSVCMPTLGVSDTVPEASDTTFDHLTYDNHVPNNTIRNSFEWTCKADALSAPVSPVGDHCSVYVRTCDLARIGLLHGDWAVARSHERSSQRLVRVVANDGIVPSPGLALFSPVLLHNLAVGAPLLQNVTITLTASPFGSRRPSIPTARSITIARIASPLTTDRTYQPLFLQALKAYFGMGQCLVKQGDVVAVPVDADESRIQSDAESAESNHILLDERVPFLQNHPNEPAFFLVTNIEHDVLSDVGNTSLSDVYVVSTVGELGCWVDSTATRMVQTGVEHSRIPDVTRYLEIDHGPCLPHKDPSNPLLLSDSPYGKLLALGSAALINHAMDYQLQLTVSLQGARGTGKATTAKWVARRLGIHVVEVDCYDILGDSDVKAEGTLRARFDKATACSPCIFILRHIDALSRTTQDLEPGKDPVLSYALRECIADMEQSWKLTGFPVIVCATTAHSDRTPIEIMSCFKHEIKFEAPGEVERLAMLKSLVNDCRLESDVSLKDVASQTAGLIAADLTDLVSHAKYASIQRAISSHPEGEVDLFYAGMSLIGADFDEALRRARASYSDSIGAPKIPNVSWDDVGGLAHVKKDILDTIQLPLDHPELFLDGLKKRSGILLYGPPGTGKTLLAKAVATSCALNFFSVKGPELLNMYIGESEANVRRVFQRARDAKPCVIFFDELDSVAPKRGNQGDSGGVMDRIVSQILAELDGMSAGKSATDVFVIGATNRPDLLDPALLRPGRFDRMLYLGVSTTHDAQLKILQALTRKFRLHADLSLERIAEKCPFHYTGADFYALCADALLKAMSRKAEELEAKIAELNKLPPNPQHPYPLTPQYYLAELATPAEYEVLVSEDDFTKALRELVPSVTQAEMEHYARIQEQFSSPQ